MNEIKESLSYKDVVRNERLNYAEVLLISPFIVVVQQYVPVLATRLGASPILLGLVTSGSALMLALTAALSGWYRSRAPDGMKALLMPFGVFRSILIWIPLVLLLPAFQAEALILLTIVANFFAGLGQITFVTLLPRYTWRSRLSTLLSLRWTSLGVGMSISLALMGLVLNAFPLPLNYFVVCGIALVITIISSVCLFKVRPAPKDPATSGATASRPNLGALLKHKPAAHFLAVTILAQIALNAAVPLITLRLVREMGASDFDFGITTSVMWARAWLHRHARLAEEIWQPRHICDVWYWVGGAGHSAGGCAQRAIHVDRQFYRRHRHGDVSGDAVCPDCGQRAARRTG